ncbi:peptidyl-alpha-hydroxyglycine alpha-amidating lyase family protein [Ancylobacter mangrovi]|uniref:peptidyl-alpha-hydroxyglycine alpha-amidating lyase family protein n=1 Tax=Ancylobacter mangrovi TaxID=2972472 RepID=UPI002163813A|nr:peptidyl-alpha-hydroxyglycine alpha-amidating lyase family protein [Ancylobacter mangrovi]MCS0500805.1 peptidyl-alpha-hydroxyglycine alpha-amidating lyase family protein [Ancylobacter mangrovi]
METLEQNIVLGTGTYRYEPLADWAKLPPGWALGEVPSVAIDARDRVYVFNRGERPLIVFDREGNVLDSWGEDLFTKPHGLHIGPDQTIYCTDEGTHTVTRCTLDGRVLLRIGTPDQPSPRMSNRPFNRPTHTALAPNGDIYVSDGYGNAAIHKYDPDGRYLMSWGTCGSGPGEFNLPHKIACDDDGWVYVVDRENHRMQVFDGNGRYETQWNNLHRPGGMCMVGCTDPLFFLGELPPHLAHNRDYPNLGPRISIVQNGRLVGRLDSHEGAGNGLGQFTSPHGLAVDSRGDLYVGQVTRSTWPLLFPGRPLPEQPTMLKKLRRLPEA